MEGGGRKGRVGMPGGKMNAKTALKARHMIHGTAYVTDSECNDSSTATEKLDNEQVPMNTTCKTYPGSI